MKSFSLLIISVFIALAVSGQVLVADKSSIAWSTTEWSNTGWGNTDWGRTDWSNTGWSNTGWGNTDWGNTSWGNNVESPRGRNAKDQLMKVTLGIKKPGGSCMVVVAWEKSSGEARDSFAKNCQDCIITDFANSDTTGAESFCQ